MADAVGFEEVLSTELDELRQRRSQLFGTQHSDDTGSAVDQAYRFNAFGLCLSGGGIRSATFNLGVLQGLSARGLLPHIDYLSTVSGGGYIGTWLHSVIRRKYDGDPRRAGASLNRNIPGQPEDDPIAFLGKYSNYLAPQLGLFSADFWVILTIWLRNMTLNQLILVPFLASVMTAAVLLASFLMPGQLGWWGATILAAAGFVLLTAAVLNAGSNLRGIVAHQFPGANIKTSTQQRPAWPTVVGMLLAGLTIFRLHWMPFTPLPLVRNWVTPAWLILFAVVLRPSLRLAMDWRLPAMLPSPP